MIQLKKLTQFFAMKQATTCWFLVVLLPVFGFVIGGCESDLARRISKYQRMNKSAAAKQFLQRTIRAEPDNAEAHFYLGRLYMREGAYEKGLSAFQESQAASPRYGEKIAFLKKKYAHKEFRRGKQSLKNGEYSRAEKAFRSVLVIQPNNVAAAKAVGQTLLQADRPKKARKAYQRALELAPRDTEILNNLSALAMQSKDYSAAIKYARRAIKQPSTPPVIRKRLAYALLETSQWSKAIRQFETLLQKAPSPELRRDYAFLLYNREKYEQALPVLQRLAAGKSPSLDVLRALGETYSALKRLDEATDVYNRILNRHPNDPEALQRLIIVHARLGEKKAVRKYRSRLQRVRTDEDR